MTTSAYDLIMGCPLRHAQKVGEVWQWGDDESYGIRVQCDGKVQHRTKCNRCGQQSGAIPVKLIRAFGSPAPAWVDRSEERECESCVFVGCSNDGVDWHHFAPRNTFGAEADNWPVLPLCRDHHLTWHRAMDGYRWQRRSTTNEVTT